MAVQPAGRGPNRLKSRDRNLAVPRIVIWILIISALLFILGINANEIKAVMDLGNTLCLSCIGVG